MRITELNGGSSDLPRIDERICERVARDFDDVGPDACMAEILDELLAHNPHYLEMAMRIARDVGEWEHMLPGFAIFYRILWLGARELDRPLPRITPETRDTIAALAGECGETQFVRLSTATLLDENPCLLQMADSFAARHHDYLGIMQGFALLYKSLSAQAVIDGLGIRTERRAANRSDRPAN